jgi:hypothetical protein
MAHLLSCVATIQDVSVIALDGRDGSVLRRNMGSSRMCVMREGHRARTSAARHPSCRFHKKAGLRTVVGKFQQIFEKSRLNEADGDSYAAMQRKSKIEVGGEGRSENIGEIHVALYV